MVGESATEKSNFTEVNLLDIQRKKAPKRLVYFSDGILEEYSSDEDALDSNEQESQPIVDPKTLNWIPYFGYMLWMVGSRTLAVCDYLGENLAWFLGITSPKFQYELDQFERIAKEEEELEKHLKAENAGWGSNEAENFDPVALQPTSMLNAEPKSNTEVTVPIDDVMILDGKRSSNAS